MTDAQTGRPLVGVEVVAGPTRWDWMSRSGTGPSGEFSLRGIPEGRIIVSVARDGGADYIAQQTTFDLNDAREIVVFDFEMTLGTTISGRVTDADSGLPISGQRIDANPVIENGTAKVGTRTDGDGRYAIPGVAPGRYRIHPCCDGEDPYVNEYYDDTLIYSAADLIAVDGTGPVEGVDFVLTLGGTIAGTVVDGASGQPIQGLRVRALAPGDNHLTASLTDNNGDYILYGIPNGDVTVAVDGKGFFEQRQTVGMKDRADLTGVDF